MMARLFVLITVMLALTGSAAAQWQMNHQTSDRGQYYSTGAPIVNAQRGSYIIQDTQRTPAIQSPQNGQPVPGQNDFFNQNQNQGIDHEQELREHREFTGFDMTDSQISNHGIADRQGGSGGQDGPGGDMGDLATQSNNPVGGLWMLWNQNDMKLYEGPGDGKRIFNTYVFQPVLPVQLNDKWRVINRPVFMLNAFETPSNFELTPGPLPPVVPPSDPFSTKAGLGDTAFIQWFSNSKEDATVTFGVGWNWMFPTATDSDLGLGKYSVGPSLVGIYLGDKVIAGAVVQQYWSYAGQSDRTRVSFMDLQYIFRYRLNPMFSVGFAPNIQWDQVTGKWTVPVGLGFDSMTMWNGKPARFGAELQYFVSHTSGSSPTSRAFDPEWNFRLYFSPIIKAPEWAKRGLFNNCGRGCRCRKCRR